MTGWWRWTMMDMFRFKTAGSCASLAIAITVALRKKKCSRNGLQNVSKCFKMFKTTLLPFAQSDVGEMHCPIQLRRYGHHGDDHHAHAQILPVLWQHHVSSMRTKLSAWLTDRNNAMLYFPHRHILQSEIIEVSKFG
jgi:hypothetical protein